MLRLAIKMLVGDRGKYLMLISGITFASLLMAQSMALFCGLMSWTFAPLRNMRAEIWVADPKVEQVNDNKPLRDTDVSRVRTVEGIAWASPIFLGNLQARMPDGSFKLVTLVGLDATTLAGAPRTLLAGSYDDLRRPNTVLIDEFGVERFGEGWHNPDGSRHTVAPGDMFEINDQEARIVGVVKAHRSFTGGPFVFTTYDRAVRYSPQTRKMMTYVIAQPAPGLTPPEAAARIERETGLRAFTETEFMWSTMWWYVRNTGIPINLGTMVLLGFIVGIAISGQTFYAFVLENTRNLAALKAMGVTNARMSGMLVLQSLSVGLIGLGVGLGIVSVLGRNLLRLGKVPFLLLPEIPVITGCAIAVICIFAALLGIAHMSRVEPAIVFR